MKAMDPPDELSGERSRVTRSGKSSSSAAGGVNPKYLLCLSVTFVLITSVSRWPSDGDPRIGDGRTALSS